MVCTLRAIGDWIVRYEPSGRLITQCQVAPLAFTFIIRENHWRVLIELLVVRAWLRTET